MAEDPSPAILDVLACDIDVRPVGAPGIDTIVRAIWDTQRRDERTIAVSFDAVAEDDVRAFAAAERRCCSTLEWSAETRGGLVWLTVGAEPQQIDMLETLFKKPNVVEGTGCCPDCS